MKPSQVVPFLFLFFVPVVLGSSDDGSQRALEMLRRGRETYTSIDGYTATFIKQQRVKGKLRPRERISMKFRKPFSIYMKWVGNVDRGKEALYVKGENGGNLIAMPSGFKRRLLPRAPRLNPEGMLAMRGNLKPITKAGLGASMDAMYEVFEEARRRGDLTVRYLGEEEVGGRKTHRFERILPEGKGYPYFRLQVNFDEETGFPLKISTFDWKNLLHEHYEYHDLRIDPGLENGDFDWRKREYGFIKYRLPFFR